MATEVGNTFECGWAISPKARCVVVSIPCRPILTDGRSYSLAVEPESLTIRLIDSVTYWFQDDPRATVAIREALYDPSSSVAVRQAAYAALKRLNALGPSDSLPSELWRSP